MSGRHEIATAVFAGSYQVAGCLLFDAGHRHSHDLPEVQQPGQMPGVDRVGPRFAAGCTDAARLTAEITERGYRGSAQTVRRFLQPLRTEHRTRPAPPHAPSVRQVTGWLISRPDRLAEADSRRLADILERSPALTALREHVRGFAEIMVERRGHELTGWMNDVDATGSPALRSFTADLRRDLDAVTAGLTLEHNSGPVEGHVNRIQMLKRQLYGRANLDLLRKRVVRLE